MEEQSNHFVFFVVEDDDDDKFFLCKDLDANGLKKSAYFFSCTREMMNYWENNKPNPLPSLILLYAFLRRMEIHQSVATIRGVQELQEVPLVVMVCSDEEINYLQAHNLNVTGYVTKPVDCLKIKQYLAVGQ